MSFTRHTENFICDHCGTSVIGTGYTNHCPQCLWSRHVDVDPGDRAADCGGMMRPTRVEVGKRDVWRLVHRCDTCGHERYNDVQPEDDWETVVGVQQAVTERPKN